MTNDTQTSNKRREGLGPLLLQGKFIPGTAFPDSESLPLHVRLGIIHDKATRGALTIALTILESIDGNGGESSSSTASAFNCNLYILLRSG